MRLRSIACPLNFNPPTSCEVGRISSRRVCRNEYFNPPTSCEVGQHCYCEGAEPLHFNPPTSCEVGLVHDSCTVGIEVFQSTHLLRGGTLRHQQIRLSGAISIHPPPARWDVRQAALRPDLLHFNPPTSCEVGPGVIRSSVITSPFQSTHLLRGGTRLYFQQGLHWRKFQSTHLLRGGTLSLPVDAALRVISIHPPPARWDSSWLM